MSQALTYMPKSQTYWSGSHESRPSDPAALLASVKITPSVRDKQHEIVTDSIADTTMHATEEARLTALIARHKTGIMTGQLKAADFEANRENLNHLILIRLHNQLMGDQMQWFHLDHMFNSIQMDNLLYRMPFRDNPASAQRVPRRGQYDTSKVEYDEIQFDLPKTVVSWDMPIEDPLRALISPTIPLEQTNEYSMKYFREKEAAAALMELKYHFDYTKKAKTAVGAFDLEKTATNNQLLPNPEKFTAGNVHSDNKFVNIIQKARTRFMRENDMMLTHFACSPTTAMQIAQNTWTENNTIFNVEAYRTTGGVRQFPGLANATMVIAEILPDNVLYSICKPMNVMVKAEGPKITKTWEDNSRWTHQTATADFHQYKCAHEDLTMKRKFGVIFDIDPATS